jgi:hypothetical protein
MLRLHDRASARPTRLSKQRKERAANPLLTLAQIKSRYPDEWILLKDPVVGKHLQVLKGVVAGHSKNRDDVDQKAIDLRLKRSAFLYTGEVPKDAVIIL